MRKKAFLWIVLICLMKLYAVAWAETAYVDGKTASRVHLRNAASQKAESMGLFYTGTEVNLLWDTSLSDEWARVNIGAMTGYIMNDYLSSVRPATAVPVCRVEANSLNLRAEPSKVAPILHVMEKNERLLIMGQTSNEWYYVQRADGVLGYVMPEFVILTGESVSNENMQIRRLGETFDGYGIYSWPAPNGQTLYFSASEDPGIKMEDVNFDGYEDVVVCTIRGASNFFFQFFVWNDGQYVKAETNGLEYGVCNYHLYPEYGIIHSDANNGSAGAEHEDVLLRWEGNNLKAIRRAVSEPATETTYLSDEQAYITTTDLRMLSVRVWDYTKREYEGEMVYDSLIDMQQLNDSEDFARLFADEQDALWKGIN